MDKAKFDYRVSVQNPNGETFCYVSVRVRLGEWNGNADITWQRHRLVISDMSACQIQANQRNYIRELDFGAVAMSYAYGAKLTVDLDNGCYNRLCAAEALRLVSDSLDFAKVLDKLLKAGKRGSDVAWEYYTPGWSYKDSMRDCLAAVDDDKKGQTRKLLNGAAAAKILAVQAMAQAEEQADYEARQAA